MARNMILRYTTLLFIAMMHCACCFASYPEEFEQVSLYTGVPVKILYAVALQESQKKTSEGVKPWPWALNVGGEAEYYKDRESMFKGLMLALQTKTISVDIGFMQVNWLWHYEKIKSPWLITEPGYNLKIGAQILKGHYDKTGDWWLAVGKYHRSSDKPIHKLAAAEYSGQVKARWERL